MAPPTGLSVSEAKFLPDTLTEQEVTMRSIAFVVGLFLAVSVGGCSFTYYYDTGRDFRSEDAKQIVKGKTTSAELVKLFGDPGAKTVKADTEETWDYFHTVGSSKSFLIFKTNNGWLKQLSIDLKNGIVTTYTVSEGANGGGTAR